MEVTTITPKQFEEQQTQFESSNFLQSSQMASLHEKRGVFSEVLRIEWRHEGELYGQAVVCVRPRYRFFKEAILLQGPLIKETALPLLGEMLQALEVWMKHWGLSRVEMNPYWMNRISNENLEVLEDNRYASVVETFQQQGYTHWLDLESRQVVGQIFRKNLTAYADANDVYEQLSNSLKRDLRKATQAHVIVRKLGLDDIEIFYTILQETAQRKGFFVQNLSYFQLMKEVFDEQAKFMVAFLDVAAYQQYLHEQIDYFSTRVTDLEKEAAEKEAAGKYVKKTRGLITDAKDQLASYEKRQKSLVEMNITNPLLPLSGYLFICYGEEVISLFGGSHDAYLNFGGSSVVNWEMMKYAKEQGYHYFNFYGTIETEEASHNDGNFNFKRQFGGELDQLVGVFSKTISPVMKWIEKIK